MSQTINDQRRRAELIAELYDLYAAGLFAYCADQLGDLGSASDVLVSVLTSVPAPTPPRAALYAFARREIHRRNIVYSPPAVDPLIDPATSLVERSLRELRPHQREVLVLCAVCGLSKAELAWVLDVAPDTAEELAVGAGHRFRQSLGTALRSAGVRVPKPVADVYGALGVSPLRDVLGRLPWPLPPAALRIHFAGSRTAAPAPMFVKPRWPSPPMWPQPLAEGDPATSTAIFPAELLTPPSWPRVPEHDATTAPMPKLRDGLTPPRDVLNPGLPLRDPLASTRAFKDPLSAGSGPPSQERPFFMSAPEAPGAEPFATGDVILPRDAPDPYMTGDVLVHKGPDRRQPPFEPQPAPVEFRRPPLSRPQPQVREPAAPLFQPRAKAPAKPQAKPQARPQARPHAKPKAKPGPKPAAEPVYRLPGLAKQEPTTSILAPRAVRARPKPKRKPEVGRRPQKVRRKDRHYDWVWELIGFLVCVAIAMIVFFSVPIFGGGS